MDGSRTVFRPARGSTGFPHPGDPPLPDTAPRACRSAWHAMARAARGQVGDFVERRYPQTFHSATLTDRDGTHVALFHAHHPLTAFVDERRHWYTDEFREPPAWAGVLAHHGFAVLSAALLLAPFPAADVSALSGSELRQIAFRRPDTVGAALFNAWG